MRHWYAGRGEPSDRLLVPSFVLGDPWRTINVAAVPFWKWLATARRHGATARLLAVDRSRFPHDIASLGRYGHVLADLPPARHPWSPLDVGEAVQGLRTAGLHTQAGPNS